MRGEYPDWNLRLDGSHSRFKADGNPDAASLVLFNADDLADTAADARSALFLPQGVDYYSACAGAGQYLLESTFSRGWRPLTDLCLTNNSRSGNGYSALFGLVGSVDGEDRLTASVTSSQGGVQTDNRQTLFFSLGYRRYF